MRCAMFAALSAALALAGCRREDVRAFTLEIPGLNPSNRVLIVEALSKYNGVRKDSYRWDFDAKTLSLEYDSMQIAKENIRQAIEAKKIPIRR
ncbi:MAG: hypothetical protein IKC80_08225 [Kiritimatiellae bacterium]|nr:hypothetical protein [Kiritimatiellia bacterium]